jgi:hypothetical protein
MYLLLCFLPFVQIQDSVQIEGKIENLTVQHYRQASEVRVSHVNILRGDDEIVETAQIQADGSFKLSLPLSYPKEECILIYGNWVYTPFIVSKGMVTMTIQADLFGKIDNPVQFDELYAEANNRYLEVEVAINEASKKNKELVDIFRKLSTKTKTMAYEYVQNFRDTKRAIYQSSQAGKPKNRLLDEWINSRFENEMKAFYYEHLSHLAEPIPVLLSDSVAMDTSTLLTFAKANCYFQMARHTLITTHTLINSLTVSKLSKILLQYVPELTDKEQEKLTEFIKTNTAKNRDLDLLNTLYKRNETDLSYITTYELYRRQLGEIVSSRNMDFFQAQFLSNYAKTLTVKDLTKLYRHIKPQLQNTIYEKSLDAIFNSEMIDSTTTKALQNVVFKAFQSRPFGDNLVKIKAGSYLYRNESQTAKQIFDDIKQEYKGQKFLLIYWTTTDLGKLKELNTLRSYLSEKEIVFITICNHNVDQQLWKEIVARHKWKGIHILSATAEQSNFWTNQFSTDDAPLLAIFDAKGKPSNLDAPKPDNYQEWETIVAKWRK